jgi:hypothetical protein
VSNYHALARHPITGKIEMADWLDDSFGHHIYGVRFPGDETIYRSTQCNEVSLHEAGVEIERLRAALEDIANERGICLTCGKLAIRGPRGAVFCDPHLFGIDQGCRWSPQKPIGLARAALEGEKAND